MDIVLRLETSADYAETEKVVREAFWNVYAPGCTEHYLVHVMRSSENFVRELAFVSVADSKIVGCVMFVKGTIAGDDGRARGSHARADCRASGIPKEGTEAPFD